MKITILLTFFLLSSLTLIAQNNAGYSIKGNITDTASKVKLSGATIAVLNAKDSIMRAFVWTNDDGSFAINNLPKGKFILLVTYPEYADYSDRFDLDSIKKQQDFGRLNMILKSRLLAEVLVKGEVTAIKIKGDTTEYNARAYKIEPNAKVEDLLKQLQGIEVDKDGKITAQGTTVGKVLVDGEEFFGDDPTLVTKNIRADMVDKVQVYDKKSDQATFTGIDDGQKTKTINIKLKEDKKNGYFGKADAEQGTDGYYSDQLLFNRFKAKMKFSFYGTLGNNGKTGLGWEDNNKYNGGSDNMTFGDGVIYINNSGGDELDSFNGQYDGHGIPLARTGGMHYDTKWNADKESLNTNYKIGSLEITGKDTTNSQNNLPGDIINTNSGQKFDKFIFRQKLDVTYNLKIDTDQTIKISVDGTDKHSKLTEKFNSQSYRNDTLLNTNQRTITNNVNGKIFDASVFYTKKFKKKGRTLSFLVSEALNQSNANGLLNSTTDFYNGHKTIDSPQIVNQRKVNINNSNVVNTNLTYTEPLNKLWSAILNYSLNVNNGTSNLESYDMSTSGVYNIIDPSLSNDFKLNQLYNQLGAFLNYTKGNNTVNFGTKASGVNFHQLDENTGILYKRYFINWNPSATYRYKFSQQQSVSINYYGSTQQPSIQQIQPIRVNTDPLNITIGNPNLTPSFNSNIYLNYNSYKVISGQSIWFNASYSFTNNAIVSDNRTDTTGKSTYQSVNLGNKTPTNYYVSLYYGQKIKPLGLNIGADIYGNGGTSYNFVNGALNRTVSDTYSAQFRVSKYETKKYEFNLSAGPTYNINQSSLQSAVNNNGGGMNANGYFSVYLPGKFQVSADGYYTYTAKTASFPTDFHKFILNASLIKTFLKEDNLKLSLSGNDLLNQNVGFTRNAYASSIYQDSYTTIKRYFMLSIIYDFNHMGGGLSK